MGVRFPLARIMSTPRTYYVEWRYTSWFPFSHATPHDGVTSSYRVYHKLTLLLLWQALMELGEEFSLSFSLKVLKPRRSFFSLTRAPIAHKSFSKEQYEVCSFPVIICASFFNLPSAKFTLRALSTPLLPLTSVLEKFPLTNSALSFYSPVKGSL